MNETLTSPDTGSCIPCAGSAGGLRRNLMWMLGLTVAFEVLGCFLRFGAGIEATRDTSFLADLTFGLRIHHGYPGVPLIIMAFLSPIPGRWKCWLLRIGVALVASDLVHHFLVLWPMTGSPHWDWHYPTLAAPHFHGGH
jgi:hypothetical protein